MRKPWSAAFDTLQEAVRCLVQGVELGPIARPVPRQRTQRPTTRRLGQRGTSAALDRPHGGDDMHGHQQVLLASANRWALMTELRGTPEPPLSQLLAQLAPVDLVLIEGWKRDTHPKVEAWRAETGNPLIAPNDPTIRAVASDQAIDIDRPSFDLDDTKSIADFILAEVGL